MLNFIYNVCVYVYIYSDVIHHAIHIIQYHYTLQLFIRYNLNKVQMQYCDYIT